jgi:ring-1,2-phenylacetyl-CoA epoxidase subunit PaaE
MAFYPLTVADARRETRDAVVITLRVPEEHREAFRFTQGQYLTFRFDADGQEEVRRSYSICSAVQDDELRVAIKRVPGGRFSSWAAEGLRPGATVEAMPPAGSFHIPLDPESERHYLGFAAGSGITPVLGTLKTILQGEPRSRFTLVYGNRASSTIMFREELEDLKNRFTSRLSVVHVLSREHQDVELFNGRITREKCDRLFERWIDVEGVDAAFVCGPHGMVEEVTASLRAHGLAADRIKFELFGTPADLARPPRASAEGDGGARADQCEATVILDGRARRFTMDRGTSVLEAGLRAGEELPYACKGGVCSTCRAKVLEGEVDMDANFALEDYEVARGYVLTCQSYPVTATVTVDYDQ